MRDHAGTDDAHCLTPVDFPQEPLRIFLGATVDHGFWSPLGWILLSREVELRYPRVVREPALLPRLGEAVHDSLLDADGLSAGLQPPLERHGVVPFQEVRDGFSKLVPAQQVDADPDVYVVASLFAHAIPQNLTAASAAHRPKQTAASQAWEVCPLRSAATSIRPLTVQQTTASTNQSG